MKKNPTDPQAEKYGIDPEKWEMIKIILNMDHPPEEHKSNVIDMRPAQKKITEFFKN